MEGGLEGSLGGGLHRTVKLLLVNDCPNVRYLAGGAITKTNVQ